MPLPADAAVALGLALLEDLERTTETIPRDGLPVRAHAARVPSGQRGVSLDLLRAVRRFYEQRGGLRKMMDANVMGNHWLCQMVLPGMADRGFGRIVMVSSIAGHMGSGTSYSYSISKAADMEMARCPAAEYGARNIRVNVIAPGTVKTSMAAAVMNDEALMRREMRRNTTGRLGEPDGSAGVAVMLAAPAGAYLNGQVIDVDDGFIMSY